MRVPKVLASAPQVLITEWVTGKPFAEIITDGAQQERNEAGRLLAEFHFSSPQRTGLLHADPHPGNFLLGADGRLIVIDFGAVARLAEGLPPILGRMMRLALEDRADDLLELLREDRFVQTDSALCAEDVIAYLGPFVDPVRTERFHFSREWMQRQAERVGDLRSPDFRTSRSLNLPPDYLLIHRVTLGATGILCQLDSEFAAREIITRWQPGFAEPAQD